MSKDLLLALVVIGGAIAVWLGTKGNAAGTVSQQTAAVNSSNQKENGYSPESQGYTKIPETSWVYRDPTVTAQQKYVEGITGTPDVPIYTKPEDSQGNVYGLYTELPSKAAAPSNPINVLKINGVPVISITPKG